MCKRCRLEGRGCACVFNNIPPNPNLNPGPNPKQYSRSSPCCHPRHPRRRSPPHPFTPSPPPPSPQDRLTAIYERLDELDAATAEVRASSILHGLGFTTRMQQMTTREFSGGWRMRVSLARALFLAPEFLLLDGVCCACCVCSVCFVGVILCLGVSHPQSPTHARTHARTHSLPTTLIWRRAHTLTQHNTTQHRAYQPP